MKRRCISCPTLIARGSRCERCQREENRRHNAGRSNAARGAWATAVKRRDGYRCRSCGGTERLEAHHVTPIAAGGTDELSNGITLCQECHKRKHIAIRAGHRAMRVG